MTAMDDGHYGRDFVSPSTHPCSRHARGSRIDRPDHFDNFLPGGPPQFDLAYGSLGSGQPQGEPSLGFRASTLLPAYNCLFHEHHGAATCGSATMDENVKIVVMNAWECFNKRWGSQNI